MLKPPNLPFSSKPRLSETACPIRFKFAMEHDVDELYSDLARHLDPHLLRVCGRFIPKSYIFFKNLIVTN